MQDGTASKPTILIVSYGRPDLLRACLESLIRFASGCSICVYDNLSGSSDEISVLATEFPAVAWHFGSSNIGFAAAVNHLASSVEGDFLLVNPDAELIADIGDFLRCAADTPRASCVAPGNLSEDRYWDVAHRPNKLGRSLVSHAGYSRKLRGRKISELYPDVPKTGVGYLSGALLYIKSSAWAEVGGFDEDFFLYSEEVDWQLRASHAGFESYFFDSIKFQHTAQGTVVNSVAGLSRSAHLLRNSQYLYFRKHNGRIVAYLFKTGLWLLDTMQRSKRGV